ncbi:hypothetical protein Dimus_005468, partial [Dionaea muscipula]
SPPSHSLHNKLLVEKKPFSEEWVLTRKPVLVVGGACCSVSSKKGAPSGSRFTVLGGADGEEDCPRPMGEIEVAVCKQLGNILDPLPIPDL